MVTTTSLPSATLGARYSVPLLAVGGGTPRYTWSVSDRWLPPGLSLSPAGVISGSPVLAGTFDFTIRAADSAGDTAAAGLSVTVGGCTTKIAGSHIRPLTIGAGVTCLDQATISGPLEITSGAVVSIQASTLGGPLFAQSPARLAVCGSTVSGPASVTGAAGPVVLGGASNTPCPADTITGLVTLTGDSGGVEEPEDRQHSPVFGFASGRSSLVRMLRTCFSTVPSVIRSTVSMNSATSLTGS